MAYMAFFAVVIAICSWLSVPAAVPFTMQTFGVFAALGLLGGKRGTFAVLLYLLLGAVGIPVFAGFSGGAGVLFGATGGYLIGFLFAGLVYWMITAKLGSRNGNHNGKSHCDGIWVMVCAMVAGLVVCYGFGTVWFLWNYTNHSGPVGLATVLGWCVLPFLLPDALKIALAVLVTRQLKPHVKL